jgi:hypothetical protein
MKLHEHERAGPHIAGLASAVQQAEIGLLLDGRWPPLKPLPVFKFETAEYRGAIDFDKLRGEWVCRKTLLPSNKVQELRGALTEITVALPRGEEEVLGELTPAEQPEQELEKDATRRREAMLAWQENHESGSIYAGLRDYLSEGQRDEIEDTIRLTLTARQLQVNPKNIAYVFDALAKAGGKLATLIEIARQNKAEQEAGVPAKAKSAAAGAAGSSGTAGSPGETGSSASRGFVPVEPTRSTLDACVEGVTPAVVESVVPVSIESVTERPVESVFLVQEQRSSPEIAHAASPAWKTLTPEIVDTTPPRSLAEELRERGRRYAAFRSLRAGLGASLNTGFLPQGRTEKVATSADRGENSSARSRVLEISGWQVAAAALLVALTTLAVVFAVGRGMMGERHPDSRKVMATVAATSSVPLRDPSDPTSRNSTPPMDRTSPMPEPNPPAPATAVPSAQVPAAQHLSARPEESTTRAEPIGPPAAPPAIATRAAARVLADPHNSEVSAVGKQANGFVARDAPALANAQPIPLARSVAPIASAAANPPPRWEAPATHTATHLSSPSTMLVSGPGDGSKPFRLTLPEKPIAASSVFAMTSQLSVLVPPEPGFGPTRKPARLQAGELVSFVWPRYPKPGERHGSAETVKIRTTIGEFGQVLDVKRVSGSTALLPAAVSAIRQWRYKPTLLNSRPVQTQEDVTIEFRPVQRWSHGGTWRAARE